MKWYQVKELGAGAKRLILLYNIYKIFGRRVVKFIVYFITFFAFCSAGYIRKCSAKYLKIIGLKPSLINQYRHFLEYSISLLDRMEVFSGKFSPERISFADESDKKKLDEDFNKGVFFICSHLGNIDVMRALLKKYPEKHVTVFLSEEHCRIFNDFIKTVSAKMNVSVCPVEDIGLETSIETQEKLNNGEFVFIAGDRTSKNAANFKTELFGKSVEFPLGTFKFAQIMEVPVYFVCAIKDKDDCYTVHLQKFSPLDSQSKSVTLKNMQHEYVQFLEEKTKLAPLQFFHFYDMFE